MKSETAFIKILLLDSSSSRVCVLVTVTHIENYILEILIVEIAEELNDMTSKVNMIFFTSMIQR